MMTYLSYFLLFIVDILMIATTFCFLKYKDFCIRLHVVGLFGIYCIDFLLLALCFYNFSMPFLLETLTIIILNNLCSLSALHLLFKGTNLGDTKEYAIRREKMIKARQKSIAAMKAKMAQEVLEKTKNKENSDNTKTKADSKNSEKKNLADIFVSAGKKSTASSSIKNDKNDDKDKKNINNKETAKVKIDNGSVIKTAEKETEKAKDEIKEQKKALKKKIEVARKNAFITRKPEKIEETEKLINEILDKYGLTEEMLNEE